MIGIAVLNEAGEPVEGLEVTYAEAGDHSFITVHDPAGRYADAIVMGDPEELDGKTIRDGQVRETQEGKADLAVRRSAVVCGGVCVVGIVLIVASAAVATYNLVQGMKKIGNFLIDPEALVDAGIDGASGLYLSYCKTPEEIAEYLKGKLEVAEAAVSFATLPAGGGASLVSAGRTTTKAAASVVVSEITDAVVNEIVVALTELALDAEFSMLEDRMYPVVIIKGLESVLPFGTLVDIHVPGSSPLVALKDTREGPMAEGTILSDQSTDYIAACAVSGLSSVELKVNAAGAAAVSRFFPEEAFPYAVEWDTSRYCNGTATLQAVAVATSGERSEHAVTVEIANDYPGGGVCEADDECRSGQCVPLGCTPNCSGRECGPDPECGTSCGTCDGGETCDAGQCKSSGCGDDCGEMVEVPAGPFMMGCNEAVDDYCWDSE